MSGTPRAPSLAEQGRQLQALQARAFAIYEDAALRSEATPHHRDAIYAQAEAETAPLLAEAEALRKVVIARARGRTRMAWTVVYAALALIVALLAWLLLQR